MDKQLRSMQRGTSELYNHSVPRTWLGIAHCARSRLVLMPHHRMQRPFVSLVNIRAAEALEKRCRAECSVHATVITLRQASS